MSILVNSILLLTCCAIAIQGRNLHNKGIDCGTGREESDVTNTGKDIIVCNICLFMGYNIDKIEDLTFVSVVLYASTLCLRGIQGHNRS